MKTKEGVVRTSNLGHPKTKIAKQHNNIPQYIDSVIGMHPTRAYMQWSYAAGEAPETTLFNLLPIAIQIHSPWSVDM